VKLESEFDRYPIETIRDLLFKASDRYADLETLKDRRDGVYKGLTYMEMRRRVERLGTVLLGLGLNKQDPIALIGENRSEWALSYLAIICSGFTAVPVDRDLNEREIRHILSVSEARVLIASETYLRMLAEDRDDLPGLEVIISMEDQEYGAAISFPQALERGDRSLAAGNHAFGDATVAPEDLAVLIFTSGTTGSAKGVMLTHRAIASNVSGVSYHVGIHQGDVVLSVLPLHHTYEATAGFLTALYQGAVICYAESLRRIADNLRETHTTVLLGVPALFEAIYRRIEAGIQARGARKFALANAAAAVSESLLRLNIRRKIFKQIHDKVGGRLRLLISGGAAGKPEVSRGYRQLGISFVQGYGMTEYAPIVSVNREDNFKDDSAGLLLPDTEVEIRDGEICVRGPSMMKGYFKNPEATAETIVDGWLHTGDLGFLDADGHLHISGRKKSLIVTPNGKNVYPEEIEAMLTQSPYVLEALVWGGPEDDPGKVEVQAIIVPDTKGFDEQLGVNQYDDQKITQVISKEVKRINKELTRYKRVHKFVVRQEEFEKTTTRKVKRYLYTAKVKKARRW
jgi:long-chain acyl-CoA synthetase